MAMKGGARCRACLPVSRLEFSPRQAGRRYESAHPKGKAISRSLPAGGQASSDYEAGWCRSIVRASRDHNPPNRGTGRFKANRQKERERAEALPLSQRESLGSTAVLTAGSAHSNGQRLGGFELLGLLEFLCHYFVSSVFLSARVGERRILCTLRATVSNEKILCYVVGNSRDARNGSEMEAVAPAVCVDLINLTMNYST